MPVNNAKLHAYTHISIRICIWKLHVVYLGWNIIHNRLLTTLLLNALCCMDMSTKSFPQGKLL